MIHKFISNDNKGNVNTLEIGSDYTKISKVVDPVNSDDAVNKRYVDQAAGKFIVTLTPTAQDFSGTMDKTVAEIAAAYEAGQEIRFEIYDSSTHYYDLKVTLVETAASDDYPAFGAYGVLTGMFILFRTGLSGNAYATAIYTLTPAS